MYCDALSRRFLVMRHSIQGQADCAKRPDLYDYRFRTEDYSTGQLWNRSVIPTGDGTVTRRYNDNEQQCCRKLDVPGNR